MYTPQQALLERITIIPGLLNGKSTVRCLRFAVSDILEMLSSDISRSDILDQHHILQAGDIHAAYTMLQK